MATFAITSAGVASGGIVQTVEWAADATVDGAGSGTLNASGTSVTYSTVALGNGGTTVGINWDLALGTNDAVDMGASSLTGGILGTTSGLSPLTQSISFGDTIVNPILFASFTDATSSLDFGTQSLLLLDSNNAQLVGNTITFTGSSNSASDGFAAQINGTFGPGSSLDFTYTTSVPFDSLAFTVAGTAAAVPEPSTYAVLTLGSVIFGVRRWRRRKHA